MATIRYPVALVALVVVALLAVTAPLAAAAAPPSVKTVFLNDALQLVFFDAGGTSYGYPLLCVRYDSSLLFGSSGPEFERLLWEDDTHHSQVLFGVHLEGVTPSTPKPRLPGALYNFYMTNDSATWLEGVKSYKRVDYTGIYPGIDLRVLGGSGGRLTYEFRLAPGVTLETIAFTAPGQALSIDADGNLNIQTARVDPYVENRPVVYQGAGARKVFYDTDFRLIDDDSYGFVTPAGLVPGRPTVVEVTPGWWLQPGDGGAGMPGCYNIATGRKGVTIEVGVLGQFMVPALCDPRYPRYYTDGAAVAAAVKPNGALAWCTVLDGESNAGDSRDDIATSVAVGRDGSVWVAGTSETEDFPLKNAFRSDPGLYHRRDAFVAKLTTSGRLLSSSYLGGEFFENMDGMALDPRGGVFVTGHTDSRDFPTVVDTTSEDIYVARITDDGQYDWGYRLRGSGVEYVRGIAADRASVWVCGWTRSSDFPATGGFDTELAGTQDAFVTRLSPAGSLLWSSYLGGTGRESATGIAVDRRGNAWVTGTSSSADFPIAGVGSAWDAPGGYFLARVSPEGSLDYSNRLETSVSPTVIEIDKRQAIWLAGYADSAPENTDSGVVKLSPAGRILATTFFLANPPGASDFVPTGIEAQGNKARVSCR